MVAMMIILIFAINGGSGGEILLTVICAAACIATIVGWVLFINTMRQRFRGSSLVLLILAYPIVQAVLLFSIFFVGCLAAVWSEGIH